MVVTVKSSDIESGESIASPGRKCISGISAVADSIETNSELPSKRMQGSEVKL